MSVYIKGLEMPTDAPVIIKICPGGSVSRVHEGVVATAFPVPYHGRLGDLDALKKKIKHDGIRSDPFVKIVCDYFKDAPTIIPADKEDET